MTTPTKAERRNRGVLVKTHLVAINNLFSILCLSNYHNNIQMTYAGNRVFNGNNSSGIVFVLFGVAMYYYANPGDAFLFIVIPVAILLTVTQAFYFETTFDDLIVKNYMIPFFNIHYRLNEITKIEFLGTNWRSSTKASVKIIREDKKSISFQAASLGIPDWQLFVNDLSKNKIPLEIWADKLRGTIGIPEE